MRRHAAGGDRHAALRQFERMDRTLRRELGVSPGTRGAGAARPPARRATTSAPTGHHAGRSRRRAADASSGRCSTRRRAEPDPDRHRVPPASASRRCSPRSPARARELGFRDRPRHLGAGRGGVAVRAGGRGASPICAGATRRCSTASPTSHRDEIDRALAGARERRGAAGARTSGCSSPRPSWCAWPSATNGLLLTIDDVHDADDASLRLLHYIARSTRDQRLCIVREPSPGAHRRRRWPRPASSLIDRHGAIELELGPLGADDDRRPRSSPRRRAQPTICSIGSRHSVGGLPFAVNELARRAADGARVGAVARRQHDRWHRPGDP